MTHLAEGISVVVVFVVDEQKPATRDDDVFLVVLETSGVLFC